MNHGGPTTTEKVRAVKKPFMVNGSDNDNSIPKKLLDEIKSTLDSMPDVPSDVKVQPVLASWTAWQKRYSKQDICTGKA